MKTQSSLLIRAVLFWFFFTALSTLPQAFASFDKPTSHIGANEAFDSKQGGETIYDALEFSLPFYDTGATCDNIDDYDEVCPYSGSTSPDVVYTFVSEFNSYIRVDLCGSSYDTKVYVYDESLNVVACNDDFYDSGPCGLWVSFLEFVPVETGNRYFIVVDGYGGDCGQYTIVIEPDCMPPPCLDAVCPNWGMPENEPPLLNGYVDVFNSGCDSETPVFQELIPASGQNSLDFCGQTGWYTTQEEVHRDNDWFVMVASADTIHIETNSSHFLSTDCDVMYLDGCDDISTLHYQMGVCTSGIMDIPTYPGEVVFLRVRPTLEYRPECARLEDLYTLMISGIGQNVVATQKMDWGELKSFYR